MSDPKVMHRIQFYLFIINALFCAYNLSMSIIEPERIWFQIVRLVVAVINGAGAAYILKCWFRTRRWLAVVSRLEKVRDQMLAADYSRASETLLQFYSDQCEAAIADIDRFERDDK